MSLYTVSCPSQGFTYAWFWMKVYPRFTRYIVVWMRGRVSKQALPACNRHFTEVTLVCATCRGGGRRSDFNFVLQKISRFDHMILHWISKSLVFASMKMIMQCSWKFFLSCVDILEFTGIIWYFHKFSATSWSHVVYNIAAQHDSL